MRVLLDTSALVKRYIEEEGTKIVDKYFEEAYNDKAILVIPQINIGEAAVVFDKYERKGLIDAKETFKDMINELYFLARMGNVILVPLTYEILKEAIDFVFKYHIYIVDAIQLATYFSEKCSVFLTFDKKLKEIFEKTNK